MKITLVVVGKIKEKYYRDAVTEYSTRLSRYCSLNVIQVQDEMTPDDPSNREREQILEKEGARILKAIPEDAYVCALAIKGKKFDSVKLSAWMEQLMVSGKSHLIFVIGGSLGLSDSVMRRADASISFSDLTFPHQLMRVILLEQIYRCFRIMKHEPYHK